MDELQSVLVKQERIAIMNGEVYGPEGKTYLRFNLGAPKRENHCWVGRSHACH